MADLNEHVPLIDKKKESLVQSDDNEITFNRSLSFGNAIVVIVTCLLGSGVYFSPALVARRTPNAFISIAIWLIAGTISYLGSLCYCELTGVVKKTGSTYIFIHETYGRYVSFPALLVMVLVMSPFGYAVVTLNASTYVCSAFIEDKLSSEFFWCTRILALTMIIAITLISSLGANTSSWFQTVVNVLQILSIALLACAGIYYVSKTNDFSNFQPQVFFNNTMHGLETDLPSITSSLFSALFCFDGWFIIASLSEEVKNPKKNIILIAALSIPFVTFLYMLVVLSCLSILTHEELGSSDVVFVDVFERIGVTSAKYIIPFVVFISMSSAALSGIYHVSRFMLSAAREGQLPKVLSLIHKDRGTPIPAICCNAFFGALAIFSGLDIETTLQTFNFGIWLEYGIAFTIVIYLRYKQPNAQRIYKVWITTPLFMCFVSLCLISILVYKIPWCLGIFTGVVVFSILVNKFLMDNDNPHCITQKFDIFCYWLMKKTNLVINKFDDSAW